jgi:DNA-binding NarL/FixJ family response regulator
MPHLAAPANPARPERRGCAGVSASLHSIPRSSPKGGGVVLRQRTRALLLDQQPVWLDALERVLGQLDIEVAAKLNDPAAALDVLARERPPLFLLALEHADGSEEAEYVRAARAAARETVVLVCSSRRDPMRIRRVLEAGAAAYILKTLSEEDVRCAIRQAFERTIYLFTPPYRRAAEPNPEQRLTERELEILGLVAGGRSNGDVARMLWVSEATVKLHLSHIYGKLGVNNRTAAAAWAHTHGLATGTADLLPALRGVVADARS